MPMSFGSAYFARASGELTCRYGIVEGVVRSVGFGVALDPGFFPGCLCLPASLCLSVGFSGGDPVRKSVANPPLGKDMGELPVDAGLAFAAFLALP